MRRLAYPMKVWLILLLIVSLIVPSLSPTIEATERSQQATSLAHIADTHVDAPPARDGERHVQSRFAAERRSSWSHSQSITATATPFPTNLLLNPGFELDANGDNRPDYWTKHHRVTRSSAVKYSGSYSMRHAATNNANYTIGQTVLNVVAGTNYELLLLV